MLQLAAKRSDANAFDDFAGKPLHQNSPRFNVINASALKVENGIGVHLADRRAVETANVVISNFELRLSVDLRLSGQQQILTVLLGVTLLCFLPNHNCTVEYTLAIPSQYAFV